MALEKEIAEAIGEGTEGNDEEDEWPCLATCDDFGQSLQAKSGFGHLSLTCILVILSNELELKLVHKCIKTFCACT